MGQSTGRIMLITIFLTLVISGGLLDKWERRFYGVADGVHLEDIDVSSYLPQELMPILEEIAAKEQTLPSEPRIENGAIIDGKPGITVDVEATMEAVLNAKPGERVAIIRIKTPPCHQAKELADIRIPISSFSTAFTGNPGRIHNIRLACQAIDFQVQWPGQVFSFNQTVGPRTVHYGYHAAPIMLDEELIPGVGGGVCQVATTLYNAARLAKLPIIERHRHSGKVTYVRPGMDAAVAYDYMDLKFKNNRDHPLVIRCYTSGNKIIAMVLGKATGQGKGRGK